ncbi:MAG: hypothetical protein EP338_00950 [Bacteroidetes bacterium]|nr:MAG: hypothetical protein EP338_00950 [Bacteroidota bacterium]
MKKIFLFIVFGLFGITLWSQSYRQKDSFYPFPELASRDSAQIYFKKLYFACREHNNEEARLLMSRIQKFQDTELRQVPKGIRLFTEAYYQLINNQLDVALKNYQDAQRYFEKKKRSRSAHWAQLGIANCYYYQSHYEKAERKYLSVLESLGPEQIQLQNNLTINLAILAQQSYDLDRNQKEHLERARRYFQRAIRGGKELGDTLMVCKGYNLLGTLLSIDEKENQSMAYLDTAESLALQAKLSDELAFIWCNRGYVAIEKKQYSKAIHYLQKAVDSFGVRQRYNMLSLAEMRLANAYEANGQTDQSLIHHKNYATALHLNFQKIAQDRIAFYETEFRTQELELKNEKQKQSKLALEKKSLRMKIFILGLASVLLVLILFFFYFIRLKNKRQELEQEQLKSNLNAELIEKSLEAMDQTRAEIGRNLHDGISQQVTGIKLGQERLLTKAQEQNSPLSEQIKQQVGYLDELYEEIRNVSHQLIPAGIEHHSLKELVRMSLVRFLKDYQVSLNDQQLNPEFLRKDNTRKYQLLCILQELAGNVVKHAWEANRINLSFYERGQELIMIFEDNGKSQSGELREGVGLRNIRYRTQLIGGKVSFENKQGFSCILHVPII